MTEQREQFERRVEELVTRFERIPGTPYLIQRLPLAAGFLPFQNSAQVLLERRQKRLVTERSAGVFVGTQEFHVLFTNHPGHRLVMETKYLLPSSPRSFILYPASLTQASSVSGSMCIHSNQSLD